MKTTASDLGKRTLWLLLGAMAVALLSPFAAGAADESSGSALLEEEFAAGDESRSGDVYGIGPTGAFVYGPQRWWVGADILPLRREMQDDLLFASEYTPAAGGNPAVIGPPALDTGDFKDEFDAGVRFFAGYMVNDGKSLETVYFGSHHYNGDMAVRTTGADGLIFAFGDTGDYARIRFSSTLNNVELNYRTRVPGCPRQLQTSWLFGDRFMTLDERFIYDADPTIGVGAANVSNVAVKTGNDLLGLQLGFMTQWRISHILDSEEWHNDWWRPSGQTTPAVLHYPLLCIDYEVKGAVYTDRADQRTTSDAFAGAMGVKKDVTAFSIDMSLNANWQCTPAVSVRAGYNFLWLTGVALGARNVQTNVNLLTMGPAKLDHGGEVIYHGPSCGLVWVH